MADRIQEVFDRCRRNSRAAFMPFLTAGYPSDRAFIQLMRTLIRAGADMIEIGVPFSDPLADGRSIQKSSEIALANGIDIDRTLCLAGEALNGRSIPLILMSYINPILAFGPERLVQKMKQSGFRGLIIPDLIPEEGGKLERLCRRHEIDLVYLLAPTSDRNRRKLIVNRTRGFVYLVSVTGVTGARKNLPQNLVSWIRQVKKESHLPVCVGFGISNHHQARKISDVADGIIIGSALVELIERAGSWRMMIQDVKSFVSLMRSHV